MAQFANFNQSFGGGVQNGARLADLFGQGQRKSRLADLAQSIRDGDYQNAGATAAELGQVGAGVGLMNIPYNREQQALQRDFQNQTLMARMANQDRAFGFQQEKFQADQAHRSAMLELQRQQMEARANSPSSFTTPQQGVAADGKPIYFQTNDRGETRVVEGITPNNPIKTIDNGTEVLTIDSRTGGLISRTPKQNYQKAFETSQGAADGKSKSESSSKLSSIKSKMPGLRAVVDQLKSLSKQATYTYFDQMSDAAARQVGITTEGALARTQYQAIVDNQILPLLRDTFGAAFTVKEGESLRATLGAPDKSPTEKIAVLEAFISQKERDLAALERKQQDRLVPTSNGVPRKQTNEPTIDDLVKQYGG